jgi:hypothetical protein
MAAAEEKGPDTRVDNVNPIEPASVGADVLEEAELPAGPEHAADLAQGGTLVGDGAQHQRRNRSVERPVVGRQLVGDAVDDLDLDGGCLGAASCASRRYASRSAPSTPVTSCG